MWKGDTYMTLANIPDWKALHLNDRVILQSDKVLYSRVDWSTLLLMEVEPMKQLGHYRVVNNGVNIY